VAHESSPVTDVESSIMSTTDKSLAVHEVYPYLRLRDAAQAIEFYKRAFGAEELFRLTEPGGRIGHAEIKLGATTLMLSDEYPEVGIVGPQALGGTSFSIHLHVDDADRWIARAVEQGATVVRPATDAFYGERSGTVRDPFGHEWLLGHQIEEVSPQEMQRRYTALFAS
jgi:PhnB protein